MKRLIMLWLLSAPGPAAHAAIPAILVFGDSLSAGYGLSSPDRGWVALLQGRLLSEGYGYRVVNASVSGETTDGGLARLPRALEQHHPAIVVLELGANDGLRALPLETLRDNLGKMVAIARQAGARVLLVGMRIPPNYGAAYTERFHATYVQLAQQQKLPSVDFFLKDVALSADLMQADGLHPNEAGQPRLLEAVWQSLRPLLHGK